jgi:DNA-directed RNA polymerase specialized sigma24 family protein
VVHASALANGDGDDVFAPVLDREPTPELAAQRAEEWNRLLARLAKTDRRAVALALAKMEGYTNAEIAERINRSIASVERKLRLIRKIWETPQ